MGLVLPILNAQKLPIAEGLSAGLQLLDPTLLDSSTPWCVSSPKFHSFATPRAARHNSKQASHVANVRSLPATASTHRPGTCQRVNSVLLWEPHTSCARTTHGACWQGHGCREIASAWHFTATTSFAASYQEFPNSCFR